MTFTHVVLTLADDPEQKLVTFAASEHDQARIAALLEAEPPPGAAPGLLDGYLPLDEAEEADVSRVRALAERADDPGRGPCRCT